MGRVSNKYIAEVEECFDNRALSTVDDTTIARETIFTGVGGTAASLTFPHYTELAQTPGAPMPFRGSNCARFTLVTGDGVTATYLEEGTRIDTGDTDWRSIRFMLYLSDDWTMANNDTFKLLEFDSGAAVEMTLTINFTTAAGLEIGWNETGNTVKTPITVGEWHSVEAQYLVSTGGAGTILFWLDDIQGTTITTLTGAALVDMEIGVQDRDSGTSGSMYIDQFVMSQEDTLLGRQIYGLSVRYPETMHITSSQQVCIGSGQIDNATLIGGKGELDEQLILYDTDTGYDGDASRTLLLLKATAEGEVVDSAGMPVTFSRGVFCDMTRDDNAEVAATDFALARASIKIKRCSAYGSEGALRNHAAKRKATARGY